MKWRVDACSATARNCPITGSSRYISSYVSPFLSIIFSLYSLSLSLSLFSLFITRASMLRTPGPAWQSSQREIKSINMWEAHATHSSVCSTRNNLRVSSSRAEPRRRDSGFVAWRRPLIPGDDASLTIISGQFGLSTIWFTHRMTFSAKIKVSSRMPLFNANGKYCTVLSSTMTIPRMIREYLRRLASDY